MNSSDLKNRELLRPFEVERLYGITTGQLQKLRMRAEGPPYMKPTHRMVFYRRIDIDAWLTLHRVNSTSEAPA